MHAKRKHGVSSQLNRGTWYHSCLVARWLCQVSRGLREEWGKVKENADDGQFQPIATTGIHSTLCLSLSHTTLALVFFDNVDFSTASTLTVAALVVCSYCLPPSTTAAGVS
jgi:hypothetical protein